MMIFFGWLASPLPLAAIYFGWKALGQIDRMPEEYTGQPLAKTGIGLGAGLGILLSGWLIFGGSEVPHGYQEIELPILSPIPTRNLKGFRRRPWNWRRQENQGLCPRVYLAGHAADRVDGVLHLPHQRSVPFYAKNQPPHRLDPNRD